MSYSEITKKYRASLSESECKALDIIGERLCETNKVMNLTALTDERGVGLLHFWDSLTLIDTELFKGKRADLLAGLNHTAEVVGAKAEKRENVVVPEFGTGIDHLRRRGDGVFGNALAGEKVGECIGNEQNLVGGLECRAAVAAQGVELEDRIEVHNLDARLLVESLAGHTLEKYIGCSDGVGIAVAVGQAKQRSILAEKGEIDAPSVNADRLDLNAALGNKAQALNDGGVDSGQIPMEVALHLDDGVGTAMDLLHRDLTVVDRGQNHAAAGGAQVDGCEVKF